MSYYITNSENAVKIIPVLAGEYSTIFKTLPKEHCNWLNANKFKANSGEICLVPDNTYRVACVYLGLSNLEDKEALAKACELLPQGKYFFDGELTELGALYWGLGQYQFDRYKKQKNNEKKQLVLTGKKKKMVEAYLDAIFLVRTLINTPCEDMGPKALAFETEKLAEMYNAQFKSYRGQILKEQFPSIDMVGRASANAPQLLSLEWGDENLPLVSIIGKGVCFDTGGLDLKPSNFMRLMKKDMGGAAHALGLAQLVMNTKLPIRIQVLIPAVENAVSGNAFRPGDIIKTRSGMTVEVDNTDAEGRLVMCDALSFAKEKNPELIIDFATLTGAARVALGTDIAAMFCNDEQLANNLQLVSQEMQDYLWRLPLHQPYLKQIQPKIAELSNASASPYGGAITAALFLQQFIDNIPWIHLDIMAWNQSKSPGKPEGGEALGLLAVYAYLKKQFK